VIQATNTNVSREPSSTEVLERYCK